MKQIKKGDFVILDCDDMGVQIGRAMEDSSDEGEYDLEFMEGNTMSPADAESSIVISEKLARFLWGAIEYIPPVDGDDGELRYVPEEILKRIVIC